MWWPPVVKSEWELPLRLDYGRSPHAYVNQRLQIHLGLLMMSDIPLETCWAFNELWNNKFRYQVASCWLLLLSHTTMHGPMNIKKNTICYFYWTMLSIVNREIQSLLCEWIWVWSVVGMTLNGKSKYFVKYITVSLVSTTFSVHRSSLSRISRKTFLLYTTKFGS